MSAEAPAPLPIELSEIATSDISVEGLVKPFDWAEEAPELFDTPAEQVKKMTDGFGTKVSELSILSDSISSDDRLLRSGSAQLQRVPEAEPVPIDLGDGRVLSFRDFITPNMPLLEEIAKDQLDSNRPIGRSGPAGPTGSGEYTKPTESDIADMANILASEQVSDPGNVQLVSFESNTDGEVTKSEATINKNGEMGVSHKVGDNDSNVIVNTNTGEILKAEVSDRDSEGKRLYITLDPKSPEAIKLLDSALSHITSGIDQATTQHTENIRQKVSDLAVSTTS